MALARFRGLAGSRARLVYPRIVACRIIFHTCWLARMIAQVLKVRLAALA